TGELQAASADDELREAERLASKGAFEESISHCKTAAVLLEQAKNPSAQAEALIRLAAAYHALGQTRLALETLTHANDLAREDQKQLAEIKAALGAIYILSPPAITDHSQHGQMHEHEDIAEETLKESSKL